MHFGRTGKDAVLLWQINEPLQRTATISTVVQDLFVAVYMLFAEVHRLKPG
jgi:hypothetical protein